MFPDSLRHPVGPLAPKASRKPRVAGATRLMSLTLILTLVPHPNGGVHPELDQVSEKIPEHQCIDGRSVPRSVRGELKSRRRFGPSSTTMHRVCSNSSNWMSLKTKPA